MPHRKYETEALVTCPYCGGSAMCRVVVEPGAAAMLLQRCNYTACGGTFALEVRVTMTVDVQVGELPFASAWGKERGESDATGAAW